MEMESVSNWSPQQVQGWMRGLDDSLQPYVQLFQLQQVDGQRLLRLRPQELLRMGVPRGGPQERLLEALDLLLALNYGVESDHLKTMVGKMRSAHHDLSAAVSQRRRNYNSPHQDYNSPHQDYNSSPRPSNQFLTAVIQLITAAKSLLAWMDRTHLSDANDFSSTKSTIVQLCLELTSTVQKDCSVLEMEEKIMDVSAALGGVCERTLQVTSDPSRSQRSCLEEVHVANVRPGDGLGIYIKSTYDGLHVVTGTTENSPADKTQRIHAGDEVVQVNKQTVVGWQLKHLVDKLRAEAGSVVLVLKKRPGGGVPGVPAVPGGLPAAPLKIPCWRPPLLQDSAHRASQRYQTSESGTRTTVLDLYIPPPPTAPYLPLAENPSSGPVPRPRSPNSSMDSDSRRRFGLPDEVRTSAVAPPPELSQPILVRFRPRSSSRSKTRPVSMPVESLCGSAPSSRPSGRKGQDLLHRYLSNDGISTITEEESGFPPPYRAQPSLRGVDHIRASRYLVQSDLHNSATIPYQEAVASKKSAAGAASSSTAAPPPAPAKTSTSLFAGWIAKLRLLSH